MKHPYEHTFFPLTTITSGDGSEITSDVWCLPVQIVNVIFIGHSNREWTLIDAGMPRSAGMIIEAAEELYGEGTRPRAIVLTHGHFDHVGAITELIRHWQVPVYAHELELPYLTGKANYPPGDPTVDGGLVSEMSPLFPNEGIDLGSHVQPLPADGSVPVLGSDWRWIHTPGHTPGHISLYRERDRTLIAGDAFVTVKQESLYKVFTQEQEISGPPKYFTPDWAAAEASVKKLADLQPDAAITGHGRPMTGERLKHDLAMLARDFQRIAVPDDGRFVQE